MNNVCNHTPTEEGSTLVSIKGRFYGVEKSKIKYICKMCGEQIEFEEREVSENEDR